ncbi:MAG: hypothetical protein JO122_16375 [Acetobacteraceae bacterium]|nr:hypothetical protein [Acetobacteraceae bacterium]
MHPSPSEKLALSQLAGITRALLRSFRSPPIRDFLSLWPDQTVPVRHPVPSPLPALHSLPIVCAAAEPFAAGLCSTLLHATPILEWRQTYTEDDFGPHFLQRYGWTELIGQRGPFPSDRLAAGFILLGPDTEYPPHRHEAEEIYIPLSGHALWLKDDSGWLSRPPGEIVHHVAWTRHAIRTRQNPLLALYLWRGGNLTQKSIIG